MGAAREYFVSRGYDKMPVDGPLCPSVPGEVDAWETMLERFGTRTLADLIRPAIELAEDGFPLPERISKYFTQALDKLRQFPTSAKIYIKADGSPYVAGDVLVQKDFATFRDDEVRQVRRYLRWLAPKPVAASSVAGSIRRSPGVTMRCAIGARNTDKASHAPTNP